MDQNSSDDGHDQRRSINLFDLLAAVAVLGVIVVGGLLLLGGGSDKPVTADQSGQVKDMTSADVVAKLRSEGLVADNPTAMEPKDFGIAPVSEDATRFLIPSLGADNGGRAFVFKSTDELQKTKSSYDDLGKESGLLFSWTFANGNKGVLVQINGDLPKVQAKRYEAVIAGL